ncbi:pseudouridine synthase [Balneola sp. MJW-20]|uniref:pseudouridine synthase n=1 Tax=Gracilimonas aurantiaca TaxID=3234185 RepID=UPI0034653EFB
MSKRKPKNPSSVDQDYGKEEEIRINKFIAHSGLCSRRDADKLVEEGKVIVNGEVVTELGTKVKRSDTIIADGQNLSLEPFTYLLLNKSKDVITTTDDEKDRTTVMDQIEHATGNRVYPVGRLDRNTTGLLILTNDGDLAHRLMHPSYKIRKTYEVETDKPLNNEELYSYAKGITLEDGPVKAFNVERSFGDPRVFMLSVYEGRNRLIRRMVEHYGKEVTKLKRIEYAGLNLKNVAPGRWRYLRQNEVNGLRKLVKLETLDFNKD